MIKYPFIWIRTVRIMFVTLVIAVGTGFGSISVGANSKLGLLFASISVMAFLYQMYELTVRYPRLGLKNHLVQHNELLCPDCGYPICRLDEDDKVVICSECGKKTTADTVFKSWMRVPEFRRMYKNNQRSY